MGKRVKRRPGAERKEIKICRDVKKDDMEEKKESKRQKAMKEELEWINASPKARQAKGKARVTRYEELLTDQQEKTSRDLEIYIPPGPRLGDPGCVRRLPH